ncbi:MAG: hypothetical protein ACRCXC_06020 [Legionella sp.]
MQLQSSYLNSTSTTEEFKKWRIYYSDVSQRALLEARSAVSKDTAKKEHPQAEERLLLLDEGDTVLDETTHFRDTMVIGKMDQQGNKSPQDIAWIYAVVNLYVKNHEIASDDQITIEDVNSLRDLLTQQIGTLESRKAQLADLSDKQLDKWLHSAQIL